MRRLSVMLCVSLLAAGLARGASADCPQHPISPKPDNLDTILNEHATWLATNESRHPKGQQADLSYVNLTGVSLVGADLREANLTGAKLQGAKLDNAKLSLATLDCVLAEKASFKEANLFQAKLPGASLVEANFANANLGGAVFHDATLTNADLTGTDMGRSDLSSAVLRNTKLADAQFAWVKLLNTRWQPQTLPSVATMGSVTYLRTIRLDETSPDPGAMERLVKALRDNGLDDQALEAAYALEHARIALDTTKWRESRSILAFGKAWLRTLAGWETDYGQSLGRGLLVALVANLLFVPVYYWWGFGSATARRTGIVKVIPAGTLVTGPSGTLPSEAPEILPLKPAAKTHRWFWAAMFAAVTAFRTGIGPFNLVEAVRKFALDRTVLDATGWLRRVANFQALLSLSLITGLLYWFVL